MSKVKITMAVDIDTSAEAIKEIQKTLKKIENNLGELKSIKFAEWLKIENKSCYVWYFQNVIIKQ